MMIMIAAQGCDAGSHPRWMNICYLHFRCNSFSFSSYLMQMLISRNVFFLLLFAWMLVLFGYSFHLFTRQQKPKQASATSTRIFQLLNAMANSQQPDLAFTKALPKVELHAHLTGSISRKCLHNIWLQKKSRDPTFSLEDPLTAIPHATNGAIDVTR
jgi:hypothetical protein